MAIPRIDAEKCTGEQDCFEVCPTEPNCFELDEYDCEMSPDCELVGGDDFGGGNSECMNDCPMYPDEMNWNKKNCS